MSREGPGGAQGRSSLVRYRTVCNLSQDGDSTTHVPNVSAIYKAALVISLVCGCTGSCFGCKLVIASAHSGEGEGHGGGKAEGKWIKEISVFEV